MAALDYFGACHGVWHWTQGCSCGSLFLFSTWFLYLLIYLNVTAKWSAKTNLCPSLRHLWKVHKMFFNAVLFFFHSSTFVIQTKDHCLSCSTTATNGVPLSQCGVNIELGFSHYWSLSSQTLNINQMTGAFRTFNDLHSFNGNQEYIGQNKIRKYYFVS